jgi:hypothetical protein
MYSSQLCVGEMFEDDWHRTAFIITKWLFGDDIALHLPMQIPIMDHGM